MSNIKKNILIVAIAIIFALFVGYGIQTFYPGPEYTDFCEERPMPVPGTINESQELEKSEIYAEQKECEKQFEEARKKYDQLVFILAAVIGIIVIIIGVVLKLESVSAGLMAGGVLTIIYGSIRYWYDMPDYVRFSLLGIVLVGLIWLGYKKLRD